jgi:hypothetical protein
LNERLVILSIILVVVVDLEKIFFTTSFALETISRNLSAGVTEGKGFLSVVFP